MKIEKLSDNQISFTLWKNDLEEYDLTITDLIGKRSDKAEGFLRKLMEVAKNDYDFETDDTSIVIEAMQVDQDCLVFVVTKLAEGENLDPRYEMMRKIKEGLKREEKEEGFPSVDEQPKKAETKESIPLYGIYTFDNMDKLIEVSKLFENFYDSDNSLYKNKEDGLYYLVFTRNRNTENEFLLVGRQLREFGTAFRQSYASRYYIEEHFEKIISDTALQTLSEL